MSLAADVTGPTLGRRQGDVCGDIQRGNWEPSGTWGTMGWLQVTSGDKMRTSGDMVVTDNKDLSLVPILFCLCVH